jgi:hypothetical protein
VGKSTEPKAARRSKPRVKIRANGQVRADMASSPARPPLGTLLLICIGNAAVAGAVMLGLLVLFRGPLGQSPDAPAAASTTLARATVPTPPAATPAELYPHTHADHAHFDIDARHLGNFELEINATVDMSGTSATEQPDVVAYTDMMEMPLAHTRGPIPMREVPGRPGTYTTRTTVPMPGEYEVRVEMRKPLSGQERKVVSVGTIPSRGS